MKDKSMKTMQHWTGSFEDCFTPGEEIDEEVYYYNLDVLPPIYLENMGFSAFQVSEPYNHTRDGFPTYSTFIKYKGRYFYLGIMTTKQANRELINRDSDTSKLFKGV
jgi:hypothetical protein